MAKDLSLAVKVKGDASDLSQALDRAESDLKDLGRAGKDITVLEKAVADVETFKGELGAAKARVQQLNAALSEATFSGADSTQIKNLGRDLRDAERDATKAATALKNGEIALRELDLASFKTGVSTKNLSARKAELAAETGKVTAKADALRSSLQQTEQAEARVASQTKSISAAFATLDIRSAEKIKADILAVNNALTTLARNSSVSGAEFDRAWAAGQAKLAGLNAELKSAEAASGKSSVAITGVGSALSGLAAPLAGLAIGQKFIEANVGAESLTRALTQITGSGSLAAAEIEYLRAASNRLGIDTQSASKAYVSLSAAAKGTALEGQGTRAVFEAIAGSMSKLGKSSADTEGALQAVAQMMSKGVVSQEEMRQQLGERLPGAFQATADATGVTVGELNEMIGTGQVLASDLIPKLTEGLNKMYGTDQAAEGTISAWNRLKNAINDTFVFVGDSGVMAALGSILGGMATAVSGLTGAFDLLGRTIGITFGAIASFDFKHPIDSIRNWKEAIAEAGADIQKKLDGVRTASTEAGKSQESLAESGKKTAAAAAESSVSWLAVVNAYGKVSAAAKTAADQAQKSAAAKAEEGKAAIALANAFGTETEKREAAIDAAKNDAAALTDVAEKRRIEAEVARSNVIALEEAAKSEAKLTEEKRKAIEAARDSADAKQAEADKAAALSLASREQVAQLQTEAEVLKDNSARVNELRVANEEAAAALATVKAAREAGTATMRQEQDAAIAAGQAAKLYRDALADQVPAIERAAAAKQQAITIEQAGIQLEIARLKTMADVAKAYGDEASASYYLQEAKLLEIKLAELTAQAKLAEANAAKLTIQAKRDELLASNQLTPAKEAELRAGEASAKVKEIEAQIAQETAFRLQQLSEVTYESASAARSAAGDYGAMASSLDGVKSAADGAAASVNGVRGPGERVSGVDVKSVLYKFGATVEEAKTAEKYYGELYQREAATRLTGNLGTDANAAYQTNLAQKYSAEEALRLARQELSTGKAVDLGTPVNDLIAKNRATGNIGLTSLGGENNLIKDIKYAGLEAKASGVAAAAAAEKATGAGQTNIYKVEIASGKDQFAVNTVSAYDANALIDALKALSTVSAI